VKIKFITFIVIAILALIYALWRVDDNSVSKLDSPKKEEPQLKEDHVSDKTFSSHEIDTEVSIAEALRKRTVSPKPNLDHRVVRYSNGSVDLTKSVKVSSQLHKSEKPELDLEIVSQILSLYRSVYKENPVGVENFEFTAALTGDNPKQVNFLDPHHPALSDKNELVDRWGSPFIFHSLSRTKMELRSLGPDKVLWTEDDIEFKQ